MIIQAGLADCDHAWMPGQFAQRRHHIVGGIFRSRMHPDHGKDFGIFFREGNRAPAALDRSPDCNDARYARFLRPTQHLVEVRCKVWVVEMRVGFNQHQGLKPLRAFSHLICSSIF